MTQPGDLNDPFECCSFYADIDPVPYVESKITKHVTEWERLTGQKLPTEIVEKQLNEYLSRARHPSTKRNMFETCYSTLLAMLDTKLGIVSFSRDWSNSIMWAHYADSHRGDCIGFELEHIALPDQSDDIRYGAIYDVAYSSKRLPLQIMNGEPVSPRNFFIKSKDWKYEQEARVLYELANADKRGKRKSKRDYLIHYKIFPRNSIKEILLGCYASDFLCTKVRKFADKHGLSVYKMHLSPSRSFKLRRQLIKTALP
jgi:hypothetical protein